jgi:lipopolysaccharide transport system ATP-binding protein
VAKPSVLVEGVSKKFSSSVRSALKYGLMDSARRLTGKGKNHALRPGEFWALDDVSFGLNAGDALGIMGVNGSGKTTLLRILNGTYSPDKGKVTLRGRIGALIAAGAGFSPLLTGRENVYISGALLGMTPSQVRKRFDEIVDFAGLVNFMDMPVRNYSSGMSVRLGFAIAAISSPEILLVDEVLAVGDISFQKKCFNRIHELKRGGTTILLVSHSPGAIWAICNCGIFIHNGRVGICGPVEDVVRAYDDENSRSLAHVSGQDIMNADQTGDAPSIASDYGNQICGTGDVICTNFRIVNPQSGHRVDEVEFLAPFALEFDMQLLGAIDDLIVRVVADSVHYRNILTIDSYEQNCRVTSMVPGSYTVHISIENQNLRPGAYTFNIGVLRKQAGVHLFLWLRCGRLVVLNPIDRFLYSDPLALVHLAADFTFFEPSRSCRDK